MGHAGEGLRDTAFGGQAGCSSPGPAKENRPVRTDHVERVINGQQCTCGQDLVALYVASPTADNLYPLDRVVCRGGCAVDLHDVDARWLLRTVQA